MEIFIYTLSVMYSPGPVNFMGLHAGLHQSIKPSLGFFLGVGTAMLLLFLIFGYIGSTFISTHALPYITCAGATYMAYMAFNMLSTSDIQPQASHLKLSFSQGFWIQLLNPKGVLVILPVTTVMYPAAHIVGNQIAITSLYISIAAAGAPAIYALAGLLLGQSIKNPQWFKRLNQLMGSLLVISSVLMFYDFLKHYFNTLTA